MYEIGQQVVYGVHGVCCIVDVEEKSVDRKRIAYFVLEPLEQPGTRYYVPSQNEAALAKLRPLMTRQTLQEMLGRCGLGDDWIDNENKRKQHYRQIINGVDSSALLRMVHALHRHKQQLQAAGRKLHLCDENFMRDAQRILSAELSIVLEIPTSDVPAYIQSQLGE